MLNVLYISVIIMPNNVIISRTAIQNPHVCGSRRNGGSAASSGVPYFLYY